MSESDVGRKWDRCMADTVVKLGKGLLAPWQGSGPSGTELSRAASSKVWLAGGRKGSPAGSEAGRPAPAPPARATCPSRGDRRLFGQRDTQGPPPNLGSPLEVRGWGCGPEEGSAGLAGGRWLEGQVAEVLAEHSFLGQSWE